MKERPRHLKFEADNNLYHELKHLVHERIKILPKSRVNQLKIKLFIYPLVYFDQ